MNSTTICNDLIIESLRKPNPLRFSCPLKINHAPLTSISLREVFIGALGSTMFGAMISSCVVVVGRWFHLFPSNFFAHTSFFVLRYTLRFTSLLERNRPKSVIKIYRNFPRKCEMRNVPFRFVLLELHLLIQHSRQKSAKSISWRV